MKIALLICDHVNEDLQHIQGTYPDMFFDLLPDLEFTVFHVCDGHFPKSANDFDAYVVNGSRRSVYEEVDWIIELKSFVRDIYKYRKKYVGVCFGHQLLAEALGGKVAKSNRGWCVGVHQFDILKQEDWMLPYQPTIQLLMMCQDQVQILPEKSVVLASTKKCPIGMFQVGKNMLGIQAHPEFSKGYDQALMELRVERMGLPVVTKGIASLDKKIDKTIAAGWIVRFLQN